MTRGIFSIFRFVNTRDFGTVTYNIGTVNFLPSFPLFDNLFGAWARYPNQSHLLSIDEIQLIFIERNMRYISAKDIV